MAASKRTTKSKSKPASTANPKPKPKFVIEKSAGAVVFYRGAQVEFLLLRSRYWEFPKGMVDADESEQAAAIREVREETGLDVTLIGDFRETIQYFYRHKNDGALVKKQVIYFLGEAKIKTHKISWEHQDARWVNFDEALELLEYENSREILRKANEQIAVNE